MAEADSYRGDCPFDRSTWERSHHFQHFHHELVPSTKWPPCQSYCYLHTNTLTLGGFIEKYQLVLRPTGLSEWQTTTLDLSYLRLKPH